MIEEEEKNFIDDLKEITKNQKRALDELKKYYSEIQKRGYAQHELQVIRYKISLIKKQFKINNFDALKTLEKAYFSREEKEEIRKREEEEEKLEHKRKKEFAKEHPNWIIQEENILKSEGGKTYSLKELIAQGLEKETFRRLRLGKKAELEAMKKKKKKKKTKYAEISSRVFSKISKKLLSKESFQKMEKDLIKAGLDFVPTGYISLILFTTLIAAIIGGFIFLFFLFFNIEATIPFLTRATETIDVRFLKVFWILFLAPIGTFLIMYVYPTLEKKSAETKINLELPFATIHMSAISGSMINPVKIFEIIISTGEYPAIEKEFTKLLNETNVYGSDIVSALKNSARNTPSIRLSELLNGLATTINSGGDLPKFFEKRAETLLFEYRLNKEKQTKSAETFMDIYISVVIAAPMVLMLLLMMMKISGLGLAMSVGAITLSMILGVSVINIIFITFLHLKRTE